MANKRYDQFPAGTYDTAKIFLQADAATGALEKVNLPSVSAGGCPFATADATQATNTGANPETMATLTIPANTITADAMPLTVLLVARYLTAVGSKTITIVVNGTVILSFTNSAAGLLRSQLNAIRISPTTFRHFTQSFLATGIQSLSTIGAFTADTTADITVDIIITAGAAADIEYEWSSLNTFTS